MTFIQKRYYHRCDTKLYWESWCNMLNFEEELKKFKPSLEVEQVEDAIEMENTLDVTDLVNQLLNERK